MNIFKRYVPLGVLVGVAALAALAIVSESRFSLSYISSFMGMLFVQFSILKLFHLGGFVEGFKKYDLLAIRFSWYGYLYPFIELLLGLFYLASFLLPVVYIITVILMIVSAIGVILALFKGLDVKCACMGTILDVPLSFVTLTEDVLMGGMALWMFLSMY